MGKQVHHKKTLSFSRKGYSLLFCALLVFSSTGTTRAEINARDTPLGMGFVLANYPNRDGRIGKGVLFGCHAVQGRGAVDGLHHRTYFSPAFLPPVLYNIGNTSYPLK